MRKGRQDRGKQGGRKKKMNDFFFRPGQENVFMVLYCPVGPFRVLLEDTIFMPLCPLPCDMLMDNEKPGVSTWVARQELTLK